MTMRTLVAAAAVAAALASSSAIAQTRPGAETAPARRPANCAGAAARADAAAATQGPTFRSGVDLITIDVGVVDGRGIPVDDLGAAEFSVKIDGEVRRVVSAELVKVDVEAAKKQVADKSETFYTSNLTPPNGRQIVIAVDQMHIRPGSIRPIMAAASRFLDRAQPARPGGLHRLSRARAARQLHQRQAETAPGDAGADRPAAARDRRAAQHRRHRGAGHHRPARSADARRRWSSASAAARNRSQRAQCERDIVTEAGEIARRLREETDESVAGLAMILRQLTTVDGHKSLILLSEGLALDDQNELRRLVGLAGAARTSINVMALDLQRGDVTVGEQPPTETQDRRIQMQGLEGLATMSLGSLFYVAGTGDPIFERLSSEISAYYLLGVEQRPKDREGDRHRIDVEVRRRDVTIRSRQAFVLSPTANAPKSANDSLRDALLSPFAVSGLPLRVTTFAHHDPASDKVRLMVSAQVGQPGAPKGEFTVGYLLVDRRQPHRRQLRSRSARWSRPAPAATSRSISSAASSWSPASTRCASASSTRRAAAAACVREVNAWKMAGETLAFGDLIVGSSARAPARRCAPASSRTSRPTCSPAHMELYSTAAATFEKAEVTLDVVDDPDGASLAQRHGAAGRGGAGRPGASPSASCRCARCRRDATSRARAITRDGKAVGVLTRPFVLDRRRPPRPRCRTRSAPPPRAPSRPRCRSSIATAAMARDLLGPMLDSGGEAVADAEGRDGRGARRPLRRRRPRGARRGRPDGGRDLPHAASTSTPRASSIRPPPSWRSPPARAASSSRRRSSSAPPTRRRAAIAMPRACGRCRWAPSCGRRRSTRWSPTRACATGFPTRPSTS